MRRHLRCSIGGSASSNEIPPLGTLLHLSNEETNGLLDFIRTRRLGLGYTAGRLVSREAIFIYVIVVAAVPLLEGLPREDPTVETCAPTYWFSDL